MNDDFLDGKLAEREAANALRKLSVIQNKIDFCSNDYLGIVKSGFIENAMRGNYAHGSTGSRLLTGNYPLIGDTERFIAAFHQADAGLIFNSGYDANVGLLSCVPQKNDAIIYDQLIHASLRDGIRLSWASAYSFEHNNTDELEKKLLAVKNQAKQLFVITESVFSMDGDTADLAAISKLCEKYDAALIVDEAHATGVVGQNGEGLVQQLQLQQKCFARIHTFGKAVGAHGAIVLGSEKLKKYLVNFSRPFIFSTALPPSATEAIRISYDAFPQMDKERAQLNRLIKTFSSQSLPFKTIASKTPIQVVIIPGNDAVKAMANDFQQLDFDIRPILYPTVPKGAERLRIVLHAFNTEEEINGLIHRLQQPDSL